MSHQLSARKVGKTDWPLPGSQALASRFDRRAEAFFLMAVAGMLVLACILALESELALAGTLAAAGGYGGGACAPGSSPRRGRSRTAAHGPRGWSSPPPRRCS